jgi:dTDP-4-dehydrorhamnose reductase
MHLVAISGIPDCQEQTKVAFNVNVGDTENVAWVCRGQNHPLLFASRMAILGQPVESPSPLTTHGSP